MDSGSRSCEGRDLKIKRPSGWRWKRLPHTHRSSLHKSALTVSSQCCVLAAERVPGRAVGSLHCASAEPLSCPCYVGHRFPPTISYPIRSAVNTVDRPPQIALEVQVASSTFIFFAPMSHIWDLYGCLLSFKPRIVGICFVFFCFGLGFFKVEGKKMNGLDTLLCTDPESGSQWCASDCSIYMII